MRTILITGTSGFIASALATSLSQKYKVVGIGRRDPRLDGITHVRGDFARVEDLAKLDKWEIDGVVHLAAVTGGCLERDGMLVNVEGSRVLMRYLIDRGVRKFVLASSIAAVGMQSVEFRPLGLPIKDEHPCLDRDAYGFSKYMMEEVTRYYVRQNPDIDVTNLRLCSIVPDDPPPAPSGASPLSEWALGSVTKMLLSDTVRALTLAVERPITPGLEILNAAPPQIFASATTAEILRNWWGSDVDLGYFGQPGHEHDSVYDVGRIRTVLGFEAEATLAYLRARVEQD